MPTRVVIVLENEVEDMSSYGILNCLKSRIRSLKPIGVSATHITPKQYAEYTKKYLGR